MTGRLATSTPTRKRCGRFSILLRVRTGQDFSNYKSATVLRRVERRVGLRNLMSLASYAEFLRGQPEETAALMKELLISVTNFFRDPDAFASLELRVIPRLFAGKRPTDHIRVWVAGCATGEEAYSIAMLLVEYAESAVERPNIQLFATDLDDAGDRNGPGRLLQRRRDRGRVGRASAPFLPPRAGRLPRPP